MMSENQFLDAFFHLEARRASREAYELLSLVKPSGMSVSHLAAEDLKSYSELIHRAAKEDRRDFFIELGKLLEGKRLKPNLWSKVDEDIAFILCFDPKIKSTDAVRLLKDRGHPEMSAVAFKQKKYNWKREAMKMRQLWEAEGLKFWNSFLDAEPDDLDDDLGVAPTSVTKLVNQCYRHERVVASQWERER